MRRRRPGLLLLGPRIRRQRHEGLRLLLTVVETTVCRRTCSPACLSDANDHDHALQMLTLEGSPAGDSGGQNTPATLSASAQNLRCGGLPQRGHPLPLLRCRRPRFRPHHPAIGAWQMHPSAPLFCAQNAPEPPDAIPASIENAVQMLGNPSCSNLHVFYFIPPNVCLPEASRKPGCCLQASVSRALLSGQKPKKTRFPQTHVLVHPHAHPSIIVFRPFRPAQTKVPVLNTGFPESSTNRTHALSPQKGVRGSQGFGHWDAGEFGRFRQRRRAEISGLLDLHSRTKSDGRQALRQRCQRSGSCRSWRRRCRGLRGRPTRPECHDVQGAWTTSGGRIFTRLLTSICNVLSPYGGA